MLKSDLHKFIFVHIPKNGGSSITYSLKDSIHDCKEILQQHSTLNDLNKHLNNTNNKIKNYKSFCIVRNPWDRVVSYYFYQFKDKMSFREFAKKSKDTQLGYVKVNNEVSVDYIVRFENLQSSLDDTIQKLNIPNLNIGYRNPSSHRHYTEYYDTETKKFVLKNYETDIEYFGYEFGE
jgi:hypothetical protein